MEATILATKKEKLEVVIKQLVDDFIKDVGMCDLKIEIDTYYQKHNGLKRTVKRDINITVII